MRIFLALSVPSTAVLRVTAHARGARGDSERAGGQKMASAAGPEPEHALVSRAVLTDDALAHSRAMKLNVGGVRYTTSCETLCKVRRRACTLAQSHGG